MKKLFIAALVAVTVTSSAFAGTISNTNDCNDLACIEESHKDVVVVNTATYTKASFVENNVKQEVFFSKQGDFIGISKNINYDKLPVDAIKTISKYYKAPKYTVKNCIEFLNSENEINYYVSLDTDTDRTVLEFTEGGTVTESTNFKL